MERRYIWFHTGPAFLLGSAGAVIATGVSLWMFASLSVGWQTMFIVLAVTTVCLTPAFIVDQRVRRSRE